MKKTFIFDNAEYTVEETYAVASCDMSSGRRQDALLITRTTDVGEKSTALVFGHDMPFCDEAFAEIANDHSAWETDAEVLATAHIYWYAILYDDDDIDWGTGSTDLDEALTMLENYRENHPDAHIAVIDDGRDPICVDVIR